MSSFLDVAETIGARELSAKLEALAKHVKAAKATILIRSLRMCGKIFCELEMPLPKWSARSIGRSIAFTGCLLLI